jgi:hypothetical protein
MALSDEQRGVVKGIAPALALTFVGVLGAPFVAGLPRPDPDFGSRMAFALRWDLLLVICVIANVAIIAKHRFHSPEDINGGGVASGTTRVKSLQATLQNTLEQAVLAVLVHLIWAATMPVAWMPSLGVAALAFAIGRILFWRGYERGAAARALGFGLTFYPSVLMTLVLVGHTIAGLLGLV